MTEVPISNTVLTGTATLRVPVSKGPFTPGTKGYLQHKTDATTAPGVGDDSGDGYAVGSIWIDITGDNAYVAVDVSVGAAVWRRMAGLIDGIANTLVTPSNTIWSEVLHEVGGVRTSYRWRSIIAASGDPTANSDVTFYFAVGSRWINTSTGAEYVAVDVTDGAAVWKRLRAFEPEYSASNIADVAHAVNTAGKSAGVMVWDTTNHRMMRARGSAAADPWDVIDGSASVTPA